MNGLHQFLIILITGRLYEHKFIFSFQAQDSFVTASGISYSGFNEKT
jgi:hypothetical protein